MLQVTHFEKDLNLVHIHTLLPNKVNSWGEKNKTVLNISEMSHHQFVTCLDTKLDVSFKVEGWLVGENGYSFPYPASIFTGQLKI